LGQTIFPALLRWKDGLVMGLKTEVVVVRVQTVSQAEGTRDEHSWVSFQRWASAHGRAYDGPDEMWRYAVYQKNFKQAQEWNLRADRSYDMDREGRFMDWTDEDFAEHILMRLVRVCRPKSAASPPDTYTLSISCALQTTETPR
jgi:hypothetical protein